MDHDDGRSDLVEHLRAAARPELMHRDVVGRIRTLPGLELIDVRIPDVARPDPAAVRILRATHEVGGYACIGKHRTDRPEGILKPGRTAVAGAVDDVGLIARLHEVVRPSRFSVATAEVVRALPSPAVN